MSCKKWKKQEERERGRGLFTSRSNNTFAVVVVVAAVSAYPGYFFFLMLKKTITTVLCMCLLGLRRLSLV